MKTDLMVLVPHEDDELIIAGAMLYGAAKANLNVKVVFITNGDSYDYLAPIRMREAVNALGVLGIGESDILFLGYSDKPREGGHLYNAKEGEIVCSNAGRKETFGTNGISEYAMTRFGVHHAYTRENYKSDIRAVLKEFLPEILITVDWDDHIDHIACSLITDECLGELFQESDYRPLVLKAQAYTGMWEGPADYYEKGNVTKQFNKTFGIKKEHPLNRWEDRIRFLMPKECRTRLLCRNLLYRAACAYPSQNADIRAISFINRDAVYWRRYTDSLTYRAKIAVSSGNGVSLSDFKCADCSNLSTDYRNYDAGIWIPAIEDRKKEITVSFDTEQEISEFVFYENPGESHIKNMELLFADGTRIETGELQRDGSASNLLLTERKRASELKIRLLEWEGAKAGLTELEIYGEKRPLSSFPLPLSLYREEERDGEPKSGGILCRFEKFCFLIKRKGRGKLWPDKWALLKKHPALVKKCTPGRVFYCHMKYVRERIAKKWKH